MKSPRSDAVKPGKLRIAPMVPRKTAWVMGGLAIVFLIAAAVAMFRSYSERQKYQPNDARIIYSEVISFGDPSKPKYRLQVEFDYTVHGERYRIPYSFPTVYPERRLADGDALRYRTASIHRIYYRAGQPYNMLLDPSSAKRFFLAPLLLTGIAVVLGAGVLVMYLRSSRFFCVACGTNAEESHSFCSHCGRPIPVRKGKLKQ